MVRGIIIVAAIVVLYVLYFAGSQNTLRILLSMALYCTLGQMWNLLSGYTGMTSLGQQIFIGLAGYSVAVTTSTFGLPFWLGMIIGAVFSAVMAFLLSALLFRMSGMYFAIATWVTAEALKILFTSWDFVKMGAGMTMKISPYPKTAQIYLMAITVCIVSMFIVYFILNSRVGLGLTAMRDDAGAAASVGVNLFNSKLFCFMISAAITGITGALFYINQGSVFPSGAFGNTWTVAAVFIVIIGGVGTMTGPIVGAVCYVLITELTVKLENTLNISLVGINMIVLGIIAIAVILFLPHGIIGTLERKFNFELLSSRRHATEIELKTVAEVENESTDN